MKTNKNKRLIIFGYSRVEGELRYIIDYYNGKTLYTDSYEIFKKHILDICDDIDLETSLYQL